MHTDENIDEALRWLGSGVDRKKEAAVILEIAHLYLEECRMAKQQISKSDYRDAFNVLENALEKARNQLLNNYTSLLLEHMFPGDYKNLCEDLRKFIVKVNRLSSSRMFFGHRKNNAGYLLAFMCHDVFERHRLRKEKHLNEEELLLKKKDLTKEERRRKEKHLKEKKRKNKPANCSTSGDFLSFVNAVGLVATGKEKSFNRPVKEFINELKELGN